MSANTLPLVCLLLGQLAPAGDYTKPLEPIPQQPRFSQPATIIPRDSRFGEPTLAEPSEPKKAAPATPLNFKRSNVVRASAEASLSSDDETALPLAEALLKRTLTPPTEGALEGRSLSLLGALQQTLDRNRQLAIVKTYWSLTTGLADYRSAVEESAILAQIDSPQAASESALLRAELAASTARLQEAKLSVVAAQFNLAAGAPQQSDDELPLPNDVPLVGPYRTQFDVMFRNRTAPIALKRIDRTLPIMQALVESRAKAVAASEAALIAVLQDYREGRVSIASVLETHRQRRGQRIAFLAAVRDYNHSIADYALRVAAAGAGPRDIVSMLIPIASQGKSVLVPSRTVPSLREVPASKLVPVTPALPRVVLPPQSDKPLPKEPTLPPTLKPEKKPTTLAPVEKTTLPPIPNTSSGTIPKIPKLPIDPVPQN